MPGDPVWGWQTSYYTSNRQTGNDAYHLCWKPVKVSCRNLVGIYHGEFCETGSKLIQLSCYGGYLFHDNKTNFVKKSLMVQDVILDFFNRMMIRSFQRPFRSVENLAHLIIWHFVVISQGKHCTLFFRQLLDRQLQFPLDFGWIEIFVSLN